MTGRIFLLSFVLVLTFNTPLAKAQDHPDVLFIAIDDMNDWVGVLGGHPQAQTPHIDALAARGMLFTNAHVVGSACLPSRTALLTGVSPFNSGIYEQLGDWRENPLLEGLPTLPRYFREQGYLTYGAGKLFHAHTYGYGGFFGQQDYTAWDAYYPSIERQLPDEVMPPLRPLRGPDDRGGVIQGQFDFYPNVTEDDAMGDGQVVGWIGHQMGAAYTGPRYFSAGIFRPHLPWYVPQRYFDMYPLDDVIVPEDPPGVMDDVPDSAISFDEPTGAPFAINSPETNAWLEEMGIEKHREAVQGYLASISFADAMVGRLMTALDRSGRAENTIIVLWSDHGYHLGEKGRWGKQTLWEESTRVPFIIVAPGVTTPGSSTDKAVSLLDIYPTLADLAGLEIPAHVDGNNLRPLLQDPALDWDEAAITTYGYGNYTVRDNRYRYIVYSDGQEELYDHDNDPNEWTNLANDPQYAAIKAGLIARLPPEDQRADPVVNVNVGL
jgi:arylsulfatase A-like enzyme